MEFRSNSLTSSSPSSSSSSPQYKTGVDTKLELSNVDAGAAATASTTTAATVEKEHMFDKVVTPSDVGKLNRLVIPKQHAEKYFPLDSSSNEKGLLLNFEDRSGKQWRFRYSYWNSSQSYVMTKGWSRFVKEKKLDAGDAVSFHRGAASPDRHRLFIDWRRRPDAPDHFLHAPPPGGFSFAGRWGPAAALMRPPPQLGHMQYFSPPPTPFPPPPQPPAPHHHHHHLYHQSYPYRSSYIGSFGGQMNAFYMRSPAAEQSPVVPRGGGGGGGGVETSVVFDSVPVGHHGKAASGKRLRLFGVNMECPTQENNVIMCTTNNEEEESRNNEVLLNSSSNNPLQLRLYNGTPIAEISTVDYVDKGKASMTTFNFDI